MQTFRRYGSIALLAVLLSVGQVGALLHGLFHVVPADAALAAHAGDADAHGSHPDSEPCKAYDGLIDAAACGAGLNLFVPPQVAATSAQYYFRNPIAQVVYSTRAPPRFHV